MAALRWLERKVRNIPMTSSWCKWYRIVSCQNNPFKDLHGTWKCLWALGTSTGILRDHVNEVAHKFYPKEYGLDWGKLFGQYTETGDETLRCTNQSLELEVIGWTQGVRYLLADFACSVTLHVVISQEICSQIFSLAADIWCSKRHWALVTCRWA